MGGKAMSLINDLIDRYCPYGITYKSLSELGSFYGGLSGKNKEDFIDGNAKLITYMNVFSNMAIDTEIKDMVKISEHEKQNSVDYGDIIFTGSSETLDECGMSSVLTKRVDEKLYLNSFCIGFRFHDKNLLLPDFSKHLFRSKEIRKQIKRTANGVTRFNVSRQKMEKVVIPIPPLPVQQEIVRILDNFTGLITELNAELDARRKQYEYYKEELLTFREEIEWKSLEDVFDIRNGYTPSKNEESFWKNGNIPWFRIEDIRENGRILSDSIQHITPQAVKGSLFPAYSIILSTSATIGEYALLTVEGLSNQRFICLSRKNEYIGKLNIKFFYYYCSKLAEWCKNNTTIGNFPTVEMAKLRKYRIPIPSVEEQERIVSILDRFDALCNDTTCGLPAEIAARQKQYEYYRDKLLTFKRKNA